MQRPKLWDCKRCVEMEAHAMSLIRNGYVVSTRRGFMAVLFSALKSDKSVHEAKKKEGLTQLEAALKNSRPIQFKENIALVLKYFDQLAPIMQEQDSKMRPAD